MSRRAPVPQPTGELSDWAVRLVAWLRIVVLELERTYPVYPTGLNWIRAVTATYNMMPEDTVVLGNATGGAFSVFLPPVSVAENKRYAVKRLNAGANAVTVDGNGANIDGAASVALAAQYDRIEVVHDGTNWHRTD